MTALTPLSLYTKTAKGIAAVANNSVELPAESAAALLLIDGKSDVSDLAQQLGVDLPQMHRVLAALVADGYIKVREPSAAAPVEAARTPAAAPPPRPAPDLDLAHRLTARVNSERRARDQVERELRAPQHGNDAPRATSRDTYAFPELRLARDESPPAPPTPPANAQREEGHHTTSTSPEAAEERPAASRPRPNTLERAMLLAAAHTQTGADGHHDTASVRPTIGPAVSASAPSVAEHREKVESALEDLSSTFEGGEKDMPAAVVAGSSLQAAALEPSTDVARPQRAEVDAHKAAALQTKRRMRKRRAFGVGLVSLLVLATAWLQFVPLTGSIPAVEQALSERLNQRTSVSKVRYVLLPTPRIVLEGIQIGEGMRVERLYAHAWPTDFFGGLRTVRTLEARGVDVSPGMLAAIPAWIGGGNATTLRVGHLKLSNVRLNTPGAPVEGIGGEVTFAPDGTVKQALLRNGNLKLEIVPRASSLRIVLNARDWRLPLSVPVAVSELTLDGIAEGQRFTATQLNARIGGGSLTGSLAAKWEGPIVVAGQFQLTGTRLEEITPHDTPDIAVKGVLAIDARYTTQADSAAELLSAGVLEGRFDIARGELSSVDLVRAIQSARSNWTRGGRTTFDALRGTVHVTGVTSRYRDLQLVSGPLEASGHVDVMAGGHLRGRIHAQMRARGSVFARTPLTISGTLKEPRLTR